MSQHVNSRVPTELLLHDNEKDEYLLKTLLTTARSKKKFEAGKISWDFKACAYELYLFIEAQQITNVRIKKFC